MISFFRSRRISFLLLLIDALLAFGGLWFAYNFRFGNSSIALTALAPTLVLIMLVSIYITNGYHLKSNLNLVELARRSVIAWVIGFTLSVALFYVLGRDYYDPLRGRGVLVLTFSIFYIATYVVRLLALYTIQRAGKMRRQWLLICSETARQQLIEDVNLAHFEVDFHWLNNAIVTEEKLATCRENMDWLGVIIENDERAMQPIGHELGQWRFNGYNLMSIAEFSEQYLGMVSLPQLWPGWFLDASRFTLARASLARRTKALLDYIVAALLITILLPVFLLIALVIKLDSKGSIFYRQVRVGVHHNPYRIIKFRSMCENAEQDGARWASRNDKRVTRVGRFLRRTRLDELPQLINVLMGDMSLIGPRPERPEFVEKLVKEIPYYEVRHLVKPGITGWAQVRYPYGENSEDAQRKLQYDLYYIKHYSLLLDALILARTSRTILSGAGQ